MRELFIQLTQAVEGASYIAAMCIWCILPEIGILTIF